MISLQNVDSELLVESFSDNEDGGGGGGGTDEDVNRGDTKMAAEILDNKDCGGM